LRQRQGGGGMTGRQVGASHVVTRAERDQAVTDWLLAAAQDLYRARGEWESIGVTMLRCGGIFTVVAVPADIVHTAAGTVEPDAVDAYLCEALHGGPVFIGASGRHYCALVPVSTACRWKSREAVCHAAGTFVRVPRPGRTRSEVGPG